MPNNNKDPYHTLKFPIYDSAAFEFETSEDLGAAFDGSKPAFIYSRTSNPTVTALEERITQVTGANGTVAVSSGMAAITNTLMSILQGGDNIITSNRLFGNTYSLFESTLRPFGIDARYSALEKTTEIESLIDARTRAIFCENITNPLMSIYDIDLLATIARKHKLLLIIDNSVPSFGLFNAKKLGVDIEIISSTKAISGGATSIGGLIICYKSEQWKHVPVLQEWFKQWGDEALYRRLKKEVFRNMGSCMSAHAAWLQMLGLETLELRLERSCANALAVAEFLSTQKTVKTVYYPGLPSDSYHKLSLRMFPAGCGGMLSFELADRKSAFAFMDRLQLIRRATNLCDNKSLIIHPASTIYCEYSPELRTEMGVSEGLIRLSVGIENTVDLIDDLSQALA